MSDAPIFTTLGCRLNAYETEAMKELAQTAGVENVYVINTCAVTAEAVRKSKQEIRKQKRQFPEKQIIVTGCAAQIDPDSFAEMAEVSAVIGNTEKLSADTWRGLSNGFIGETERVQVDDIMSVTETAEHLIDGFGTRSRAYVQSKMVAIIAVHFASYPLAAEIRVLFQRGLWLIKSNGLWTVDITKLF